MKRSEINQCIREFEAMLARTALKLPPFCCFTPQQWLTLGPAYDEIRRCRLGWDITDYGLNDFARVGFSLITLRNGGPGYAKPYAEKLLFLKEMQSAPLHYHYKKMEDIINRGGGNLMIRLYACDEEGRLSDREVRIHCDGVEHSVKGGASVTLSPGESITLPPYLYHDFHVEPGSGDVLIGEVSMVNDDVHDNHFFEPIGRFPAIEEDEPPYRLLCCEYPDAPSNTGVLK